MMGAGKSAVGRSLAVASGRGFLDTDQMLQHKLGRSVSSLFNVYGEAAFRDHETCILRDLQPSFDVLSTGGGIVVRDENWPELRRLGTSVYLDTSAEMLIERLTQSKKKRPLLQVENWEDKLRALLDSRVPLYRQADLIVPVTAESVDEVAGTVLQALQEAGA